ncbi:ribonuclease HI [Anaerohalosphaeraceae bacterium U12dextr]
MRVVIYTDGGCSPNPGLGGWAAVLISPEHNHYTKELSGAQPDTTNNRMELLAAIRALEALKTPCQVELHTDSKYLQHAFTEKWLDTWQRNDWKTAAKKPVVNQDLWCRLLELTAIHSVRWCWVKGHSDNKYNQRCDELVQKALDTVRQQH